MNCVERTHILKPQDRSCNRVAMAAAAHAVTGKRPAAVEYTGACPVAMSRDAKRTGLSGSQGYTQYKFIGVEDNQ